MGEPDLIPPEKLSEGFEISKQHIKSLLKNSELLYDKKRYLAAIPLAVLAYEETAKLRVIVKHILSNKGITKKEWIELSRSKKKKSSHKRKLSKLYEDAREEITKDGMSKYYRSSAFLIDTGALPPHKTYSQAIQENPLVVKTLEQFDRVKQDCFYLDWKNDDWFTFNKVSKNQQKALCYIIIFLAKIMTNTVIIEKKFQKIPVDKNHPTHIKYKKDPHFKENIKLEWQVKKPDFQIKRKLAMDLMDELYETKHN